MIWLIFGAFLLLLIIFVFAPLLRKTGPVTPDGGEALAEARRQLTGLDNDLAAGRISDETASETRRALELRVLDLLNAQGDGDAHIGGSEKTIRVLRLILPIGLCLAALGLYTVLGQPNFKQIEASADQAITLEELVVTLQQKLGADATPPAEGYLLLARSLMTLDRYDEAFVAYETTLRLSEAQMLAQVQDEYQRAQAYAQAVVANQGRSGGMPVLDDEAMASAAAMTPEARAQMIEGMVAGLAARLDVDPNDAEGWIKLIRARMVLGQDVQARVDLQRAIQVFENNPEQLALVTSAALELGLDLP